MTISYAILGLSRRKIAPQIKIKLNSDLQQRQKFPPGISGMSIANKNKINIRKLSLEVKSLSKIFTKKCIYGLGSIKKSLI